MSFEFERNAQQRRRGQRLADAYSFSDEPVAVPPVVHRVMR